MQAVFARKEEQSIMSFLSPEITTSKLVLVNVAVLLLPITLRVLVDACELGPVHTYPPG